MRDRRYLDLPALAETLAVSPRTVRRDLEALEYAGWPVPAWRVYPWMAPPARGVVARGRLWCGADTSATSAAPTPATRPTPAAAMTAEPSTTPATRSAPASVSAATSVSTPGSCRSSRNQ